MNFAQKKMLEILEVSRQAFEHTLEKPDLVERVKEYGFDSERLKAGLELARKADDLFRAKKATKGQKTSKNLNVVGQLQKKYSEFIMSRRILKKAYRKEPGIMNELLLNVSVPPAFFARIKFIKAFFEICQKKEDLLAKVSRYGLSSEKIASTLEKLNQIEKDAIDKSTVIMEDEKATQDRNKAFEELNHELETFKIVLIAVLGPDNQALEEFGIIVPSEGLFKKKKRKKTSPEDNTDNTDNTDKTDSGDKSTKPTTPAPAATPEKKADSSPSR